METPFDKLSGATPEDYEAFHQVQYEQGLVNRLLNHYGLKKRSELLELQMSLSGERHLTLYAWHVYFPTFPIYLMAKRFRRLTESCNVGTLFRNFYEHKFVKAYEELYDGIPDTAKGMAVGLIFPWPRLDPLNSGGLVFHDLVANEERPGFRMTWVTPGRSVYHVQHLQSLLADIDYPDRWTP